MAERRTLANTKATYTATNRSRSKPMVAKAGATRKRTPYKYGGKVNK
jgi:hypothetical protein